MCIYVTYIYTHTLIIYTYTHTQVFSLTDGRTSRETTKSKVNKF